MQRLHQHALLGSPRSLPAELKLHCWLNWRLLGGLALAAWVLVYFTSVAKSGRLPTDVALWLDSAEAPATITSVEARSTRGGKPSVKKTSYNYHFQFQTANGQWIDSQSISSSKSSSKTGTVQYYPKNPQINRLKGMSAPGDSMFYGTMIVVVISSVMSFLGLRDGWIAQRLFKYGSFAVGKVVACRNKTKGSRWEFGVGNFTFAIPVRQFAGKLEIPLAEFQASVLETQCQLYDSRGQFIGTPSLRMGALIMAALFGCIFGAILSGVASIVMLQNRGFDETFRVLCVGGVIGAIVGTLVEFRWRIFVRGNAPKADALPAAFQKTPCVIEVASKETDNLRVEVELDLTGDVSDAKDRQILYRSGYGAQSRLLDQLNVAGSIDSPNGEFILSSSQATIRLSSLLVIVALSIIGMIFL